MFFKLLQIVSTPTIFDLSKRPWIAPLQTFPNARGLQLALGVQGGPSYNCHGPMVVIAIYQWEFQDPKMDVH